MVSSMFSIEGALSHLSILVEIVQCSVLQLTLSFLFIRKIKVRIKQLLEGHRKNTFNWTTDVSQMTVLQLPSRIMREKDVSGTLLRSFCKVYYKLLLI